MALRAFRASARVPKCRPKEAPRRIRARSSQPPRAQGCANCRAQRLAKRSRELRAGNEMAADRSEGQVDHREGHLRNRVLGRPSEEAARELGHRRAERVVQIRMILGESRCAGIEEYVLAPG